MRRKLPILFLFLLVAAATAPVWAGGGEVNLFYGQKDLDLDLDSSDDFLSPLEDQTEYGILFTYGHSWPVAIAIDILQSSEDVSYSYDYTYAPYTYTVDASLDADVMEIDLGVRKYFGKNKFQFYVGGGVAFIDFEATIRGTVDSVPPQVGLPVSINESESDNGTGYWLNAGAVWRAGSWFNLGVDVRYSDADVTLGEDSFDAGGTHYGAYVGFQWGR